MKRLSMICLFLLVWAGTMFAQTLKSPDGNLTLQFRLSAEGTRSIPCNTKEKMSSRRASWDSACVPIINSTATLR